MQDRLDEPLAIIGMNCQFPGIDSDIEESAALHEMLMKGQTPIKEVPSNRFAIDDYYDADRKKANKIIGRKGGFLNNPQLFDRDFFKISPAEAKQMDPQHRLFLEVSIRALNHANITLGALNGTNTGVFCGMSADDYSQLNYKDKIKFNAYTLVGASNSAAAGRLSHFLNLKGPCLSIDTACSSSLSALYVAANLLRTEQCPMAIVGGVHFNLCPEGFIVASKANLLSASDQCSSFDSNADGFARSEGCGVVIVKRLRDAIKDNNKIHAIIKSIVMNQDGDGISVVTPNRQAQIAMHEAALKQARVVASDIDYIETNGTGTPLGDSVEFNAIQTIHQGHHSTDKPLIIGALKSNLGHTLSSSGIASLIKVINAFQHEVIPPNLHYSSPNPLIDPQSIPALLPIKPIAFIQQDHKKRIVQLSNFGFTGVNVAAIIEEPPAVELNVSNADNQEPTCFVISANSEASLHQMMANHLHYLKESSSSLVDICYTLINCRDHYQYRCAIIAEDKKTLINKIESKDYAFQKVTLPKELKIIAHDAHLIYENFLLGINIKLDTNPTLYNKVDLPLYSFDRKPYWHEPRIETNHQSLAEASVDEPYHEPIAIIGMSCRFPKASNVDEFLSLLENGECGMTDIPLERWDNDKFYDSNVDALGRLYIKQLGLIDNVKNFDAEFFNISPREAKLMSPQLRIFMETSYHAIEDANLSLDSIKNTKTGVFVGCESNEYPEILGYLGISLEDLDIYYATGNASSALPGRIAYVFDFHGPIQTIDTACSSAMTAIHAACLSLQSQDCNMALAGGIKILLSPVANIILSKAKMLSPESRCKTFSEDADGYARSEGCGVIVLKRLSTAIKDNDTIHAVIKGSAINNDGKSTGFTVPNAEAQEAVIRSALARAKLCPSDIDYIETHGTGTPVADPVEANTLCKIFGEHHSQDKPLYISSVKTNIGHCESASGVAGIIKAVLSLQRQTLFKHLNFKKLNPAIQLKNTIIPLSNMAWHKEQDLRCAGVNSFGFSGANAHVVLQQAPNRKKEARTLPQESLLVLSAKKEAALELLLSSYQHYLLNTHDNFADICFTAATCRSHFLFRVAIKAETAADAAAIIEKKAYTIHQIKKEEDCTKQPHTIEQLLAAFQEGRCINWAAYYHSIDCQFEKVKLPLYQFAREEHWFGETGKLIDAPTPRDWGFQLQWQHQYCNKNHQKKHGHRWLLIGAEHAQSSFIAQGLHVVLEQDEYRLDKLDGIIFAAGLDPSAPQHFDPTLDFQKKAIKKLLSVIKTLNQQSIQLQLIVLTTNAVPELSVGPLNLTNCPLIGLCKTLVLELPQYNTILIDVDYPHPDSYALYVLDEIMHNHSPHYEHVIAYRGGKRLAARLNKAPLTNKKRSLLGEGRYLITGASGGLGLVTAQALLSAGAREVMLVSRHMDKPSSIAAINTIQSYYPGRTIRTMNLDVTDKENLRSLLIDLNADGLLKGIIHAAGTAIKIPLIEHQDDDLDDLFSAKVTGGWYLHELSQHCNLDFFVVYSSISSVFGSNKESVYSAANSFLDGLIAERHRLGLVGTSIQWGPWGQTGMAVQVTSRDPGIQHALVTNGQGHTLIKILLNSQLTHATIISPDYLSFMLDFVPKPMPAFHQDLADNLSVVKNTVSKSMSPWLSDYLEMSNDKRSEACKAMLCKICKTIMELPETDNLDEDEGFFDIGFDSLMITEMAFYLQDQLEPYLKITVNIGFDYPSINKLSAYLESELNDRFLTKEPSKLTPPATEDSIAIIGMSCSLPHAPDIAAFARLLEEGLSGIKDIPIERWDNRNYYDSNRDAPGKSYVNKHGLLENIKHFDAHFFGISPREAKMIEPQQRIFLECCYHTLENANYHSESLRGSLTGVFAGVGPNEYYMQLEQAGFASEDLNSYAITGNVLNLIPGRVAYTFDFKGPSISVDTACSSSLVAIHYACQSLKNREIDYALAGGVNILIRPESNIGLCKSNALSPDGQCKTFDEKADGYARGEGCGVVFLKRLADAIRDKDNILAVIKGSAVNNDGKSAGLMVPNGKSQEEVMLKALSQTNLSSHDISYIEAHGTGTPLGDPIEAHAINRVYGNQRSSDNPLYMGTVKTNIGHLESAAGIAGLIKTVIGLQHKKIYKHLNFNKLNPNIQLDDTRIALHNTDWQSHATLNSAGVNAFGFSGTNAHVILQEFPAEKKLRRPTSPQTHSLILSAKSKTALDSLIGLYQHYLKTTTHDFCDICFTAATCREHYQYRLALNAVTALEASQRLSQGEFALSYEKNNTVVLQQSPPSQSLLMAYLQGKKVDWVSYYNNYDIEFIKVLLPNYPFDQSEYWPDNKNHPSAHNNLMHPLLGQMLSMPGDEYLFNQQLDLEQLSYIKQHRVFDKVIFPATAFIESGLAAAKAIFKDNAFYIEKFTIERPFCPKQNQAFQLQVKPMHDTRYKIKFFAKQDDSWLVFSDMEIQSSAPSMPKSVNIDDLKSSFDSRIELTQIYEHFERLSLGYGDEFQVLQEGYVTSGSILSKVSLTKTTHTEDYYYHPILLDGAMQSLFLLSTGHASNTTYVPYTFTRLTTFQDAPRTLWVHLINRPTENDLERCVDIKLYDNSGLLIADIVELKFRQVTRSNFIFYDTCLQHLYYTNWDRQRREPLTQQPLPELLVISKNATRAQRLMGNLNYQRISDFSEIVSIENKNIVFLYEQDEFDALFHCCQTLFKRCPARFILVTENAYAIEQQDPVNPYHTMASSFWKSFRNELDFNRNYTIDLDASSTLIEPLTLIFNEDSHESQMAMRDSIVIPRLKRKQLQHNLAYSKTLFAHDAHYLIVGGTGGLGRPLLEYLIQRGVKHITITSRSKCPIDITALIEVARQKQINIRHYEADASNYQHMETILSDIGKSATPLKGVFHLAGIVQDGLIVNLDDEDNQSVLRAKMDSALILHQLTQHLDLDLFVLFSSSASLLGAKGQSNYAAANGFLDGLAHLRHQQGLPAMAINWGPFQATGMTSNLTQALKKHGFIPLAKEHLDMLDVLLKSQLPQISPCMVHWDTYFKYAPKQTWLSALVKTTFPAERYFLTSLRQQPKEVCITILSQALIEITTGVLALEDNESLSAHDDLFSLGLDSLLSLEIRNRIHDKLQCPTLNLSIEYFINYPSIDKIARYIADELQPIFDDRADFSPAALTPQDDIALCDFQYVFWVIHKLGHSFNIGMQLQLNGKLNKDYLFQAFDAVVAQHDSFWIHFNEDAPTQQLKKHGQFELIYEDISLKNETIELNQAFNQHLMQIIPLTKQPLIKIYLYKINSTRHELHLIMPHIIADDVSCDIVFRQFKKHYETLSLGNKLIPAPAKDSYFNYVKRNNSHYEKNLKNKIDFWQDYNKGFSLLNFGSRYHLPPSASGPKHLYHYPLAPHVVRQFTTWHQAKNINVSTGLIAACQLVFHKISQQKKFPIILIHSGREGSQNKSIVGLFSEYKRINLSLNEPYEFIDCVQSIEAQLLKTAPYQTCSHLIKDRGLRDSHLSLGLRLAMNYQKILLAKYFKKIQLNTMVIDYYLEYFSSIRAITKKISLKYKFNQWFKLNRKLYQSEGLRVLISITPSFFSKDHSPQRFADINYTYANHFGSADRPTGNRTLWVYFSRNQQGEYLLSINGPITTDCKDLIADEFNSIISSFAENDKRAATMVICERT